MNDAASGDAAGRAAEAVGRLDQITRRLRRECPWDREQDARSIVPHTVEEAYELAEAVEGGEHDRIIDELGDVLFQVLFLSLLLEEQGDGDLAAVAEHCRQKLIRRHPHVFGDAQADTAAEVLGNWDRIKREQEGDGELFANVPENLPALLYARKLQRRAASRTEQEADRSESARELREWADELGGLLDQGELAGPSADTAQRDRVEHALGQVLFWAVDAARRMQADPELALRATAGRFRELKDSGP